MKNENEEADWKLKLRYGKLKTPFKHYTAIAEGVAHNVSEGFTCPDGPAFMSMKCWATDADEATDMIAAIGGQIGFEATGRVYIYDTEANQPPGEKPLGYDISFTSYKPE